MPRRLLCASVSSPIGVWSNGSVSPSRAMASSSSMAPYLCPARAPGSRCGARVIDSMPPATTMSNSPARMSWAASAMASRPDRHTLLIVIAGTVIGIPAATAAWRAGICPAPACRTWPMITYWTSRPATPERSSAALITMPPRSVAARSLTEPSRRPMGVLAPPVITASGMFPPLLPARERPGPREAAVLHQIDHVGIACYDLEAAIARYESVFDLIVASRELHEDQGVQEAMLRVGEGPGGASWIQLLEPTGPDTPVGKFLARRGEGIHHIGYRVTDITAALEAIGARGVRLLDRRPRHGSMGASIAFLHPADMGRVLTELVQPPGPERAH